MLSGMTTTMPHDVHALTALVDGVHTAVSAHAG
jgi:hypothetical protein